MKPRVLVTGGSGFIGRCIVEQLAAHDVELHATSRRPPSTVVGSPDVRWHAVDFLDPERVDAMFDCVRPTHWLHLAWISDSPAYWTSPRNLDWLQASLRALETFTRLGGQRVVGVGTCAEYDWSDGWCVESSTPYRPATLYGAAKLSLATMFRGWSRQHGIGAAWGRVFHLYGPREASQRFVASVARAALAGEPARCTSGTQRRDLLHVDDVAAAFVTLTLSEADGEFNIASAQPVTLAEVARTVATLAGRPDCLYLGALADRPGDSPLIAGNNEALLALGWKPSRTLEAGLADTVEWWRRQGLGHGAFVPRDRASFTADRATTG